MTDPIHLPKLISDQFGCSSSERKHAGIRLGISACECADDAIGPWVRVRVEARWYRVERLGTNGYIHHCSTRRFKKALQVAQGLARICRDLARICRVREANGYLEVNQGAEAA